MSSFGVNVLGNSRGVLLLWALLSARLGWSEVLLLSSPKEQRIHYQDGAELLHRIIQLGQSSEIAQKCTCQAPQVAQHRACPCPRGDMDLPNKTRKKQEILSQKHLQGRKAQIFQNSCTFGDSLKENSIIFVWQHSIRRTFSVSGSPEKKFPEKQDKQRTGRASVGRAWIPLVFPDLQVEPQGDCWALGWQLQRQKTKPGENVPGTTISWEFNSLLSPGFFSLMN